MPNDPDGSPAEPAPRGEPSRVPADLTALFGEVYGQLRAMAQQQLSNERDGHSLAATELVHSAYLRLFGAGRVDWASQQHLVRAAAEAMRRILIEHARARGRIKRGGGRQRLPLSHVDAPAPDHQLPDEDDLLALDEALRRLEAVDARAAEVVRLRFFAGLSIEQAAEVTGLSERTVKREWTFARAWLAVEMNRTAE
jgi:RNA polymerase sigma factor (TIGR02999 family)